MIESYILGDGSNTALYEVLVVPQSEKQFDAVKEALPNAQVDLRRGGKALVAGIFFSKDFVEEMCDKYISLGLFSTVEHLDRKVQEELQLS